MSLISNKLGINNIKDLNKWIEENPKKLIEESEKLQNQEISELVDKFQDKRIVFIAGPSSSGKTTFSNKIRSELSNRNINSIVLSMDNYFVDREYTPIDENNNLNFECIEAVDMDLFKKDLKNLVNENKVNIPSFNFKTGKRERGNDYQLNNGIIIVEGIHALNPVVSSEFDNSYKIFICPESSITSNKVIRQSRRMLRDVLSRGVTPKETLEMWPSITRGENNNIFPFINESNYQFNSHLLYEFAVMKSELNCYLTNIYDKGLESDLKEINNLLNEINELPIEMVPEDSIIREFIGGSKYYNY